MKIILIVTFGMYSLLSWSQSHVAIVKSTRGEVLSVNGEEKKPLEENDLVSEGMILRTNEEGFLVLVLQDNTRISLGSLTEIKLTSIKEKKPSLIELTKGRIRLLVTGDDTDPKLLIKTPSSFSTTRDGEFITAFYNSVASSVVLKGEITLQTNSKSDPEKTTDGGVKITSGKFSVVSDSEPSIPSLLNIVQKELLEKNKDFITNHLPFSPSVLESKLVVPQGLSGYQVSNNFEILTNELRNAGLATNTNKNLVQEGEINPLDGSYLQIETGTIIPPDSKAIFDTNSKTYLPSKNVGSLAVDGTYLSPGTTVSTEEVLPDYKRPFSQSFFSEPDKRFPANGGIKNINDPQRAQTDYSGMTIRLRDN